MSVIDNYKINLPTHQKMQMYKELLKLEDQARKEYNKKYPIYSSLSSSEIHNRVKAGDAIMEQYKENFGTKYNLTYNQVSGLIDEGVKQVWSKK